MLDKYPLPVKILFLCAIGRALCVFTILPFLPIYLNKILGLSIEQIGYLLGIGLFLGTLTSVYSGYLVDKLNKFRLVFGLVMLLAALFFLLPLIHNVVIILLFLILINTASSSMSIASNALFADYLPPQLRSRAFSLRYSLENIGAAIGPFIGVAIIHYNFNGPFWVAGIAAVLIILLLVLFQSSFAQVQKTVTQDVSILNFTKTLHVLRTDGRLILFTIGGILSMAVYGPLITYLSQYLVVVKTPQLAYQTIAYVSAVNAVIVILLQYLIGSRIKEKHLMNWLKLGLMAFITSLFALSLTSELLPWLLAIALFTVGEIIIVPAEYMYIDTIAPDHLKGAYFGAQNLIFIGVAISPILCGILLNHMVPQIMFYALISLTILSWFFYYLGARKSNYMKSQIKIAPSNLE